MVRAKSMRLLSGALNFARELSAKPDFIPVSRARGAKREGIKYERDFANALGSRARHGIWFQWRDSRGLGWCQTDVIYEHSGAVYVFECKYTWTADARRKLEGLYIPLIESILGKPTFGIVVCRKLTRETPGPIVGTLEDAMRLADKCPTLHWDSNAPALVNPANIGPTLRHPTRASRASNLIEVQMQ